MNPIAEEMLKILTGAIGEEDIDGSLMHYGMPRRSGRYPWGSGEDPYQHGRDFLTRVEELRKKNFVYADENGTMYTGDKAIYKSMGLSSGEFRAEIGRAKELRQQHNIDTAMRLREKEGLGATEIGRRMGVSESTVRGYFQQADKAKQGRIDKARATAEFLKARLKDFETEGGMLDVGKGVERELGISSEKMKQALQILKDEGYEVYGGGIKQPTNPGQQTNMQVLCPPGTKSKEIYELERVHSVREYASHDGGETFEKFQYPSSLDSKRLKVLLADEIGPDGEPGVAKDGLVQIRRGVPDLSLGNDTYAQVRILVDNERYIKGMAVYSDNLPDGVDVLFNSNKTSYEKALKEIKNDPDNPFGSLIMPKGQSYYTDAEGNKKLSLINKRASEGDWSEWADALPSQFLGKQSQDLAKKQLGIAKADKEAEFRAIMELTNPTIKKHLLREFADNCDGAAVHLKAAALPGQKYHAIIPINTIPDNEVYAPNYKDGTKLALVRYPHGGIFEIPILTVNNKHAAARRILGEKAIDAVGINKKVADQLSGADFDGDTVMAIPTHNGKVHISSDKPLKGLEGFDPRDAYPERPGMQYMKDPKTGKDSTQKEMGVISNLITDMTLGGADKDELARAVRHSMVVIDAGKHKLDYKKSEADNNIAQLKRDYQQRVLEDGTIKYGGASTILSRAKGEATVDKRQGSARINDPTKPWYDPTQPDYSTTWRTADKLYYPERKYDKETGMVTIKTNDRRKITYNSRNKEEADKYDPVERKDPKTGEVTFVSKDGTITYKTKTRTQPSTNMAETHDAYTLVSKHDHPMERLYAEYANSMKDLANRARKELVTTPGLKYDASAKKTYAAEVKSLNDKLDAALENAPREREALRRANVEVSKKQAADPNMSKADIKKEGQKAVSKYRAEVASASRSKRNISITDREWEAIQAGAISDSKLSQILANTDTKKIRERATPRASKSLSSGQIARIKAYSQSYTLAQLSEMFNVSTSTISKYLKGES